MVPLLLCESNHWDVAIAAVATVVVTIMTTITIFVVVGLLVVCAVIVVISKSGMPSRSNSTMPPMTSSSPSSSRGLLQSYVYSLSSARIILYDRFVDATSDFVMSVLSRPKLKEVMSEIIVESINTFIHQPDFPDRIADISTSLMVDTERRKNAARSVGKDVVPMVSGFVGGVASSFRVTSRQKKNKIDNDKMTSVTALTVNRKNVSDVDRRWSTQSLNVATDVSFSNKSSSNMSSSDLMIEEQNNEGELQCVVENRGNYKSYDNNADDDRQHRRRICQHQQEHDSSKKAV